MCVELIAITPDAEAVIEQAGRTCYQSASTTGEANKRNFIRRIIENGHYSVLEHAYATFKITEVSRSFTHQLVRHRLCAFSQRSQRYVNEKNFAFIKPESIREKTKTHELFEWFIAEAKNTYCKLQELGIKNEDARFVLPNAVQSEIVISTNFRELRHIFCVRCNSHAQWEIRNVALQMLRIMKKEAPSVQNEKKFFKTREHRMARKAGGFP
jgi:thymidylate synthase (FAD)